MLAADVTHLPPQETSTKINAPVSCAYTMRIGGNMKQIASTKKATNISLAKDVYTCAKELGINISQVCEQALREHIRIREEQEWNAKNAAFIEKYNQIVEAEGTALQEWRGF